MKPDPKMVAEQVGRFAVCDYYPGPGPERDALGREIKAVLMNCDNDFVVVAVIDEYLRNFDRKPTPKTLAGIVGRLNVEHRAEMDDSVRCRKCSGQKFRSIPVLIEYKEHSLIVKKKTPMPDFTWDAAMALAAKLGDNQTVVSGAIPCDCNTASPDCTRCQDSGVYGGHIGGKYSGPWKWCNCRAGEQRRMDEPGLVVDANSAREKISENSFASRL